METNAKLAVVAAGLAIAAIALVWAVRRPAPALTPPPLVVVQEPRTPAEILARSNAMESFHKAMVSAHDHTLKDLLDAEDYSGDDFCGRARRSLRNSIDYYAHTRFTDFDLALSQALMSEAEMAKLWGTPSDVKAIRQANGRLQHGYLLKGDFDDWRAVYMKLYSFPEDATPVCPGPIVRGG